MDAGGSGRLALGWHRDHAREDSATVRFHYIPLI